jgi:hypothetical protein
MMHVMKNSGLKRFSQGDALLKRAKGKSMKGKSAFLRSVVVDRAMVKSMLVLTALVIMTSCGKTEKPEIVSFELGYENSKTAFVGGDLHMDAEVVAEGTIDKIRIEIHPEDDHGKKGVRSAWDEGEWEVDTTYTKFSGLKNTTFHEHIEIPMDAEPGDYHFHFEVTDMEGYQTVYEEEIEIKIPVDAVANHLLTNIK